MAYMPHLHYCCACGVDLGAENGDGICAECEEKICEGCGSLKIECECKKDEIEVQGDFRTSSPSSKG